MAAADKGEVGAVLVWKLDRFGRSSLDVLGNIRRLTDAGVRFVAVTHGLDVKPQGDSMSPTAGAQAIVFVRPEDIRIADETEADGPDVIEARVVRAAFLGDRTEYNPTPR